MMVLGVDPGSLRTGYGVIDAHGSRQRLVDQGVLVAPRRWALPARLHFIHDGIADLIRQHDPEILAVEDAFHAVNTRTALVLGHVRGVILLAGAEAGLPVEAFSPATVKVQVTGYGRADKGQVALMVARILDLPEDTEAGDAADALAVALCGAQHAQASWEPERRPASPRPARRSAT
jgi:crossover junction endodeoxyribonuclease RuvC